MTMRMSLIGSTLLAVVILGRAAAGDRPQWGERFTRNMVSSEVNLPDSFDPASGRHLRWKARLGTEAHSTPVIGQGRVLIGTNNGEPRDPKHKGDRGVLMCFRESDGTFLWQYVVPKLEGDIYLDWPHAGMSSPATVVGDRVYMLNNRGEVTCLDLLGMANGNQGPFASEGQHMALRDQPAMEPGPTDADILWLFNLAQEAGTYNHDAAHSSFLIDGPFLYLNTGNGVDNTHRKIRRPEAPSLIVLDAETGRYLARDDEGIGPRIFHCTWSSPSMGTVHGQKLVFFGGGDGVVYAFKALTRLPPTGTIQKLERVWRFDCDPGAPKENVHRYITNRRESPSNIKGMPVYHDLRVYVAVGGDLWWGKHEAWLKCIDATRTGDITGGGELWSYPLERHVMATPAVHDGLVYIADCGQKLHCVDAKTGQRVWVHQGQGEFWASPLVADGKVLVGSRAGDFHILAAGRDYRLLSTAELEAPISSTAVAANGVLYVTTMKHLYAVAQPLTTAQSSLSPP
jgi:outer membrane protein assembly factor BamB